MSLEMSVKILSESWWAISVLGLRRLLLPNLPLAADTRSDWGWGGEQPVGSEGNLLNPQSKGRT